jgi:amino acid transporter
MTSLAEHQTPEPLGYVIKRLLLGKPLITEQLQSEKLSNAVALGVLSPDAISSVAYGPEAILTELVPYAGLAAFALLLPVTGVILVVLVLVASSYREVVMAYTRAGGSYVVSRDNFGPRVAQIAAAALLIDYVVTVAVQCAAGTVAVVSAIPVLGPYSLEITIAAVLIMCYANLRGLREAGRSFAVPTYFFVIMCGLLVVTGVIKEIFWGITPIAHQPDMLPLGNGQGLLMGASILVVLRAFANGGSSLTGVEAISNAVNVFRKPQGPNARRVLTTMAAILGSLLAGVAYLAYKTHATPYAAGYPSVLSEIAQAVFGRGFIGHLFYDLVQTATALILFTGGNTSFNGFPALANFVAGDRFLPRWLTKRGQRLVFSNAILLLTTLAIILLVGTGGTVDALLPLFAMGVFTGFSMAGYGMTKHHLTHREPGWRHKLVINLSAGVMSTAVVLIFAVAKFTEGAWLIVVVGPLLVFTLIRLNREYRAEAAILEKFRTNRPELPNYARHRVFVLVDYVDLAVIEALRYGRSLRADELTAVHFMIDSAHAALLRKRWDHFDIKAPLRVIDCPDRRLTRAAKELAVTARDEYPDTHVTMLLPRRNFAPFLGRLLHDRTADSIAQAISQIPDASATIVPYDVQSRIREAFPDLFEERITRELEKVGAHITERDQRDIESFERPAPPPAVITVEGLIPGHRATVEGRVGEVDENLSHGKTVRVVTVSDDSGDLRVLFTPGHGGAEILPGQLVRITGKARQTGHRPVYMSDPEYQIVDDVASS